MVERRHESRIQVDLPLSVWGIETRGETFLQKARTSDISRSGALLSEIDVALRSGDVIGVLYAGKKARFRVAWVRYSETEPKVMAAIRLLEEDECPWEDLLPKEAKYRAADAN